jgi:heme-degrading monooxygenase HmoA
VPHSGRLATRRTLTAWSKAETRPMPAFGFMPRPSRGDTDQDDPGAAARAGARTGLEEAAMEEHFVWMTTRRIKPGTLTEFERAWRPDRHPEGMLTAYAYWSDDEQQIIGVSLWASRQSCDAWRASDAEARRRAAHGSRRP